LIEVNSLLRINCLTLSNNCCAASINDGRQKEKYGGDKQLQFPNAGLGSKPANEVWMQFEAKNTRILVKCLPRPIYDELDEKETFWGLPPAVIGELRRSEYDQAVRFYTTRYDGVIKKFPSEWNFKRLKAGFIFKCALLLRKQIW
jgi:hypothetical protein